MISLTRRGRKRRLELDSPYLVAGLKDSVLGHREGIGDKTKFRLAWAGNHGPQGIVSTLPARMSNEVPGFASCRSTCLDGIERTMRGTTRLSAYPPPMLDYISAGLAASR
jgi:hypothetical protein